MSHQHARATFRPLLAALFVMLVAACGSATMQPAPAVQPAASSQVPAGYVDTTRYQKAPPYTLCFSNASVSNTWRVSMVEHLRYEVKQHPEIGTLREADANDDAAKQVSDINTLLQQGCDALIVSATKKDELKPAVDKAMEMGVPVVTLNRNVSGDNYVSFVASNNCTMGREQAEWLASQIKGKGDIVLLSGVKGASNAEDRLRCAREVFAKYPDIKELAQAYANWSPVEGKKIMADWLKTFATIDGVWSDGQQSAGAVKAFVEAGRSVPPITGEDYNGFLKSWKELGFEAIAVGFPVRMGRVGITTALEILSGKPVPHQVDVPHTIITKDKLSTTARPDLPDSYWAGSDPEVVALLFPK